MKASLNKAFAERADTARRSRGLSQAVIAKKLGVSQPTVGSYLKGEGLDLDTAAAPAEAVGSDLFTLLGFADKYVGKTKYQNDTLELEQEIGRLERKLEDLTQKLAALTPGSSSLLASEEGKEVLRFLITLGKDELRAVPRLVKRGLGEQ